MMYTVYFVNDMQSIDRYFELFIPAGKTLCTLRKKMFCLFLFHFLKNTSQRSVHNEFSKLIFIKCIFPIIMIFIQNKQIHTLIDLLEYMCSIISDIFYNIK